MDEFCGWLVVSKNKDGDSFAPSFFRRKQSMVFDRIWKRKAGRIVKVIRISVKRSVK